MNVSQDFEGRAKQEGIPFFVGDNGYRKASLWKQLESCLGVRDLFPSTVQLLQRRCYNAEYTVYSTERFEDRLHGGSKVDKKGTQKTVWKNIRLRFESLSVPIED